MVQLAAEHQTPATYLEEAEETASHQRGETEFADAFARILSWIFSGGEALDEVGLRTYILGYKIRPDLINGKTLEKIAALKTGPDGRPTGRSNTHNLATEFSLTFGIRCRNEHRPGRPSTYSRGPSNEQQLQLINRFTKWRACMKRAGIDPMSNAERSRLRRELAPLIKFAQELGT